MRDANRRSFLCLVNRFNVDLSKCFWIISVIFKHLNYREA